VAPALARCPSTCILVLTGSTEREVISRVHAHGVRYLLKPCDATELDVLVNDVWARRRAGQRRIRMVIERWRKDFDLTDTEVELLKLGAEGVPHAIFGELRSVEPELVRKQIRKLLDKTGEQTFEAVVNSLLREAIAEPT
jgi:DNA-binding NarL/FixJ family response regulator